jgi:hypothetical protein
VELLSVIFAGASIALAVLLWRSTLNGRSLSARYARIQDMDAAVAQAHEQLELLRLEQRQAEESARFRSRFRCEADHHSALKPITIPE